MSAFFEVSSLGVHIGDAAILDNINIEFREGEVTALLGHNGSGKSTLLKVLARQMSPSSGNASLLGSSFRTTGAREFARTVGYLPQHPPGTDGLTVRELVALGRYPWRGPLGRYTGEDHQFIDQAIHDTGLDHFQHRANVVLDRQPAKDRCFLRQITDPQAGARSDFAVISLRYAGENFQECRLAAAVAPDHPQVIAIADRQRRRLEHFIVVEPNLEFGGVEQCDAWGL